MSGLRPNTLSCQVHRCHVDPMNKKLLPLRMEPWQKKSKIQFGTYLVGEGFWLGNNQGHESWSIMVTISGQTSTFCGTSQEVWRRLMHSCRKSCFRKFFLSWHDAASAVYWMLAMSSFIFAETASFFCLAPGLKMQNVGVQMFHHQRGLTLICKASNPLSLKALSTQLWKNLTLTDVRTV